MKVMTPTTRTPLGPLTLRKLLIDRQQKRENARVFQQHKPFVHIASVFGFW